MNRKVPLEMLIKAQEEPKVTKEEEMTVILQVNFRPYGAIQLKVLQGS